MFQRCAHAQNKNLVPNLRFLIIMTRHSVNRRDLLLPTECQWNVVPKTSRLKTNTLLKYIIRGKNWMRSTLAAFFFWLFFIFFFFFAASFLIPYIICLVFCGIPIFYLEVALGQYVGQGVVGAWAAICPFLGGKWFKCYAHAHLLMIPSRNQTLTRNSFIADPSPQKFNLICWEKIVWQLFIRRKKSTNLSHWRKSSFSHHVKCQTYYWNTIFFLRIHMTSQRPYCCVNFKIFNKQILSFVLIYKITRTTYHVGETQPNQVIPITDWLILLLFHDYY